MQSHSDTPTATFEVPAGQRIDVITVPGDRFTCVSGSNAELRSVRGSHRATPDALVVTERGVSAIVNKGNDVIVVRMTRMGAAYGDLVRGQL